AAAYRELYAGESGATHRLGRAMALRTLPNRQYDRTRKQQRHAGPYLPIIYEACKEQELAYEYRHGVTSYGAFTYSLSTILRQSLARGRAATFEQLLRGATQTLKDLHYDQHPVMLGPKKLLQQPIPWQRPGGGRNRPTQVRSRVTRG